VTPSCKLGSILTGGRADREERSSKLDSLLEKAFRLLDWRPPASSVRMSDIPVTLLGNIVRFRISGFNCAIEVNARGAGGRQALVRNIVAKSRRSRP
jgi:hypothetical protein